MNANRLWYLIGGVAIIAILALGWFLGVSPQLTTAAAADAERSTVEQENAAQTAVLEQMKAQFAQLPELTAQLEELQKSVPGDADTQTFHNIIVRVAQAAKATLHNVSFAEAEAYGTSTGVAAPTDPNAAPTPTTPSVALTPSAGLMGSLYRVPVSITLDNNAVVTESFVSKIQKTQRLFLINSITFDKNTGGTTIAGYLFVVFTGTPAAPVPEPEEPDPSVTPTPTPEPTDGTATPAPTGSSTPTPAETTAP